MSKVIITIGGSKEFKDYPLASKELNRILKERKIDKKDILVYAYEDSFKPEGAYSVVEKWAKASKIAFLNGQPKEGSPSTWNERKEQRDKILSEKSNLFINLRVGSRNGGRSILELVDRNGVPMEIIDSAPTVNLTPSQKRKGVIPTPAELKKSIAIYSKVAQKLLEQRCLMLDTETTGLSSSDEVVELAIGDCYSGVILFESLVKPGLPISYGASQANGITNDMLDDAPTIDLIWERVNALVGNRIVLASHSTSETEWFDERLLNQSLYKYGLTASFIWKDLQPLYRLYSCQTSAKDFPLKTEGMCLQLGVEQGTHRAKNDVLAQIRILQAMAKGVKPNFKI